VSCRNSIDFIYKQLTRSAVHPLGGQAFLSLENEDEPYSGGVNYIAMPPTKRFRDMDQLSGAQGGSCSRVTTACCVPGMNERCAG
jgi:chromosome segregation ATPase